MWFLCNDVGSSDHRSFDRTLRQTFKLLSNFFRWPQVFKSRLVLNRLGHESVVFGYSENTTPRDASTRLDMKAAEMRAKKTLKERQKVLGALPAVSARRLMQTPLQFYRFQLKPRIEVTAVVYAATGETCHSALDLSDAREIAQAIWAAINETRRIALCWKGERMTALFARDAQINASLLPPGAVRRNPTPPCAKSREEMGKFVPQSAIDFFGMRKQPRVQ